MQPSTSLESTPHDQSQEKLDQFVRDGASSHFNQFGSMADTISNHTFIKRAKRVDSNDLPLDLDVQNSQPFFTGDLGSQFRNASAQPDLLSDGLFDKPESFIFGSNKEDF